MKLNRMDTQFRTIEVELPSRLLNDLRTLAIESGYDEVEDIVIEGLAFLMLNRERFLKTQYKRNVNTTTIPS